ncbi:hypothetical protein MUB24_18720 [Lederbergia sp. NSJ-179]|uniref:hypothetical protein n=1 Tax=Lederbergia sp. NSJ-179 TaxID=2931402 RepID=UPI001FD330B1|nr:hypothetical protein [Lederbergia sp. NSJ-179]MCJ7842874.1 hypothetical protein [Lederbergia sp. NSJ-179]
MRELQEFTKKYQKELNYHIKEDSYERSKESILMNHMLLSTEVAEIAELLRELFTITNEKKIKGFDEVEAFRYAKREISDDLGKEISDCIAYLCKLANFFERDIEKDFYDKMEEVKQRVKK